MTTCRGCGREIVWAETSHGKKVPLDPKALVFSVVQEGSKLIAVKPIGMPSERWMVSHFATCPAAADFSGRNRDVPVIQRHFSEPKESAI